MENLTAAITSMMTMVGDMLTAILANPVLALIFAGGVIGIVLGVFRKLIRSSKG